MKRSSLARGTKPLRRTALKRTPFISAQPRKPIPQQSSKRRAEAPLRAAVREAIGERDRGRCRLLDLDPSHRCFGGLTLHHLKKASQGGAYSLANGLTICADGNSWIEREPNKAYALGLVLRRGDDDAERRKGLV